MEFPTPPTTRVIDGGPKPRHGNFAGSQSAIRQSPIRAILGSWRARAQPELPRGSSIRAVARADSKGRPR
eukprot:1919162-Alexandrium_andersonii.AAC.1